MLPPESARPPRKVGACPYRGLIRFPGGGCAILLRAGELCGRPGACHHAPKKLVAVIVGSSGSGKSSALFAGLLPRLRKAGGYQFASFRPGSQPFYSLAGCLSTPARAQPEQDRPPDRDTASWLSSWHAEGSAPGSGDRTHPGRIHPAPDRFCWWSTSSRSCTPCAPTRLQKAFIDELLATVEASQTRQDRLSSHPAHHAGRLHGPSPGCTAHLPMPCRKPPC